MTIFHELMSRPELKMGSMAMKMKGVHKYLYRFQVCTVGLFLLIRNFKFFPEMLIGLEVMEVLENLGVQTI